MRRYQKGQTFRPPTVGESAIHADTLEGFRRRPSLETWREVNLRHPHTVLVRNDGETDWDELGIVELVEPILTPGSFDPRILLSARTPTDDLAYRHAVLTEPLAAGRIGPAVLSGWMPVKLSVTHDADLHCGPEIGDDDHMLTGGGSTPIIWKGDAGTEDDDGFRWGVVLLGDHGTPVVEFELLEDYAQFSDTPVDAAVKTWSRSANSGEGGFSVDCTHVIPVCDFNKEGHTADANGFGKCYMRQRDVEPKWAGVIFDLCCPGEEQGAC